MEPQLDVGREKLAVSHIDKHALSNANAGNSDQHAPVSIPSPLVGVVDAGRRNATLSAVEPAPFGKDLWILDSRTNFDMCPTDTIGFRTNSSDLGCAISATGSAFPDHTITTCIDALHEDAECVPLDGLAVRLLAVG